LLIAFFAKKYTVSGVSPQVSKFTAVIQLVC